MTVQQHESILGWATLPLVVGVSGHRNIPPADHGALIAVLRAELRALRATWKSTPVIALSSLAEGADRLFAECAIELGIPLIVPLPLPQAEYERDFAATGQRSVDHFRQLMSKAAAVFQVPAVDAVERLAEEPQLWRDLRYAQAGLYISQRSQILFALWDGEPAQGVGGTGQIVSIRSKGKIEGISDPLIESAMRTISGVSTLADPDMAAVRWIPVRRSDHNERSGAPSWIGELPQRGGRGAHHDVLDRMDDYNSDVLAKSDALEERKQHVDGTQLTQARFAAADLLASSHVTQVRRYIGALFLLAFAAVVAHASYVEIWRRPAILAMYLVALVVVGLLAWGLRKRRLNPQSVDLRALAEGLRIQHAWELAGLTDAVSQHYLRRDAERLRWVRQALAGAAIVPPNSDDEQLAHVRRVWVEAQRKYFRDSNKARTEAIERSEHWSSALLWAGGAAALLVLTEHFSEVVPGGHEGLALRACTAAIGLLPAAAGLLSSYVEFSGLEEDVREHRRMLHIFDRAAHALEAATPLEQRRIIFELGVEALHENARWAATHKARDPKAPTA